MEWIGKIPEGWRVEPLKFHSTLFKGLPIQKNDLVDEGVPVISYGQVHAKWNTGTHTPDTLLLYIPKSLAPDDSPARLENGDVVFADTSEDVEGIGNEALIDRDDVVYAGYHVVACRPDKTFITGKYLAYLTHTGCWRKQLRSYAMGVKVYSVTQTILGRVSVIAPPISEQCKITSTLDTVTADIDEASRTLESQVSILESYKSSLIYEAVTKGLDRNVEMKSSGIEWIGNVPSNWEDTKLKYICSRIFDGPFGSHLKSDDYVDDGVRVVRLENIKFMTFDSSKESYITAGKYREIAAHTVYPSDLIMATFISDGMKVCQLPADIPFAVNKADCIGIRLQPSVCKRYIHYYLSSHATGDYLQAQLHGATRSRVNTSQIRNTPILLPPISEQHQIADYLDDKCSRIDRILELKREQFEVLKKRRASLIYEYVTGKRRVE